MDEIESRTDLRIYTIGHSNHPMETLICLLKSQEIEVLIDTRSSPFSRYSPQFNRDRLKSALQAEGIKYGFYGRELGGKPEGKEFYDAEGRVLYSEIAKSSLFQDGLARLVQGAENRRIALLCSEENPCVCHRRLLIARILDGLGLNIAHIRGDGRIETERELQALEAQAAESKMQAKAARQAAKREERETAARVKQQRKWEAAAARLEKKQERQRKAEQQSAERKMQTRSNPRKAAQPKLFDMEER